MTISKIIVSLFLFVSVSLSWGDIYSWIDSSGNRVYSDQKPGSDKQPATTLNSTPVNYYSAPVIPNKPKAVVKGPIASALSTAPAETPASELTPDKMTEEQCQEIYQLDCDDIINWRKKAIERCGNDPRCEDENFLTRKYKPVPVEEIRALAQRNAARRNRQEDRIRLFILQSYSDYCEVRKDLICDDAKTTDKRELCEIQLENYCEQDRDLEEVLAQYDHLTPVEKQRYYKLAKHYQNKELNEKLDALLEQLFDSLMTSAVTGGLF